MSEHDYSGLSFGGRLLDARSLAKLARITLAMDREEARLRRLAGDAVAFVRPRGPRERRRTL